MITKSEVDPKYIIELVCNYYIVAPDVIMSYVRYQPVATARQVAMYLIGLYTDRTLAQIGTLLNRRKPGTVSYAFTEVGTRILVDAELSRAVKNLRDVIDSNGVDGL